jgi:hypothetical protein
MPAGRVCDLHVRDAVGIGGDHGIKVVDIDGEMVEVAEQREVRHAALPCDSVDHIDDLGGGAQRVARRPAQRLEEHRAADPGGRPAGEGEVLDGQRILRLGCRVLHPVAVERVDRRQPSPTPIPMATSRLSLNSAQRAGQDTSPRSPRAMSPAKKFSPTSATPASATARTNASTLRSAGTRVRERPPELDRGEAGLPCRRGPLEQRHLGQDRQVDRVSAAASVHLISHGACLARVTTPTAWLRCRACG